MLSIKDGESMTIYKNQVINPEKPWSFMDDTKENILKDLAECI